MGWRNPRLPSVPASLDLNHAEWFTGATLMGLVASQIEEPDKGWGFYATSNVKHGKGEVKAGMRLYMKPEDFDFDFEIDVQTAAKSDEQKQAAFESELLAIQAGLGITEDALTAKGITDIQGWMERKNKDDAYKAAAALWGPNIFTQTLIELLRVEAGVLLTDPMAPQLPVEGGQVNPAQGAPPPQTEGAMGGAMPTGAI